MAEIKYYVGDVGTLLVVSTGNNLTTATTLNLLILKPSGAEETWIGTINPLVNTQILYTVQETDFDEIGRYKLQAYVVYPSGHWRGNTATFLVQDRFA